MITKRQVSFRAGLSLFEGVIIIIEKSKDWKTRVLSLSYGKDSMACLGAIEKLGWPLDRIITAELWATDDIPADLPPMVEFKEKADKAIRERYGIDVTHVCAERSFMTGKEGGVSRATYEKIFYMEIKNKQGRWARNRTEKKCHNATGKPFIYGFPCTLGAWCNSKLKVAALNKAKSELSRPVLPEKYKGEEPGADKGIRTDKRELVYKRTEKQSDKKFYRGCEGEVVQYIGIASDETVRVERHKDKPNILMPLVEVGWTEADCKQWCIDNDLLSPIYSTSMRGGCWFCHNQSVDQLRLLRRDYPDLWALLLKWDIDSPLTFKPNGRTVHDYDKRFHLEDMGLLKAGDKRFKWSMLNEELNYSLF